MADVFDQIASQSGTAPQSGDVFDKAAQPAGGFSVSAVNEPTTFLGKFGRWAENVSNDIKYGTDETGIGTVLKKMGAHGVYSGAPEAVGDYMASLPLGLLRASKGVTEVAPEVIGGPKGKTMQGLEDVVGGGMQALEEPAAFVAPEAGEAAAEGAGEAAGAVKKAAGAVKEAFGISKKPSLEEIKQSITAAGSKATSEAGVANPTSKSIAKTLEEAADNIYAKAKSQYKAIDEATGGRVQRFDERLKNIRNALRELTGTEEDEAREAKLLKSQKETEEAMSEAFEDAKKQGVDPKIADEAKANFKKSQALYDVDNAVKKSTSGMRPDIGDAKTAAKNPEVTDPEKFFKRINDLHRSGRLQEALGDKGADELLTKSNEGLVKYRGVVRNQKLAKGAGKVAAIGAGLAGAEKLVRGLME